MARLRVLVLPKNLEVGGTQVAAADLSSGLALNGHEVVVAAPPGPLGARLEGGVTVVGLPPPEWRLRRLAGIVAEIRRTQPDVIHAFEVRQVLDAVFASRLAGGPSVLGSIFSTRVPWFLPESVPLTVGMPELARFTRLWRTGPVDLLPPPIRVRRGPGSDAASIEGAGLVMVLVSRLVEPFKREGILRAIAATAELDDLGARLLVLGDGPARALYEEAAGAVNGSLGRDVVRFLGEEIDSERVLGMAHVAIGSGVSAMQAAARAIPTVIVGREGFSAQVTPANFSRLAARGFYGVGAGLEVPDPLPDQIRRAASTRSDDLEGVGRLVLRSQGMEAVVPILEEQLARAARRPFPSDWELTRALARIPHYRLREAWLAREARARGLVREQADNHTYGKLRNLALPPARAGTGRNRLPRSETEFAADTAQ